MVSLTPTERSAEATGEAIKDGFISGALTFIPSLAGVAFAMRYPKFKANTNYQSRTALVVMPTLFVFCLAAEKKLGSKMRDMADEHDHSKGIAEWAERENELTRKNTNESIASATARGGGIPPKNSVRSVEDYDRNIKMYRQSVEDSGVRIVPGAELSLYQKGANFWQENPFKILAGIGIPTVLYILKGNVGKEHLQLQSKLMHTRVYGQFAVLGVLVTLMGFKTYMDGQGKFITEKEAEARVKTMEKMREQLLAKIDHDKKTNEKRNDVMNAAHEKHESDLAAHADKDHHDKKK